VLQCVAACCSVLQYVAVCCSVLQCVAKCFPTESRGREEPTYIPEVECVDIHTI